MKILQDIYCRSVGIEITHLHDGGERDWLVSRIEEKAGKFEFSSGDKKQILNQLMRADLFEKFLHHKFVGQKRFSSRAVIRLFHFSKPLLKATPILEANNLCLVWLIEVGLMFLPM